MNEELVITFGVFMRASLLRFGVECARLCRFAHPSFISNHNSSAQIFHFRGKIKARPRERNLSLPCGAARIGLCAQSFSAHRPSRRRRAPARLGDRSSRGAKGRPRSARPPPPPLLPPPPPLRRGEGGIKKCVAAGRGCRAGFVGGAGRTDHHEILDEAEHGKVSRIRGSAPRRPRPRPADSHPRHRARRSARGRRPSRDPTCPTPSIQRARSLAAERPTARARTPLAPPPGTELTDPHTRPTHARRRQHQRRGGLGPRSRSREAQPQARRAAHGGEGERAVNVAYPARCARTRISTRPSRGTPRRLTLRN